MNAGDTVTFPELLAAWRTDRRANGSDPDAADRSRIIQASFGVALDKDPPRLRRSWVPDWVDDPGEFASEVSDHRGTLAFIARSWAAVPEGKDPFEGVLEAPRVIGRLWEHHGGPQGRVDAEGVLSDLVATVWNLPPTTTAVITTSAAHGIGPAARIVDAFPPDDEPIACPVCGWAGTVGDTELDYFGGVFHRECPDCEKMLLIT